MGDIAWTDETWNPTVGCSVHSPGCTNCYAMKMTGRLALMGQAKYAGLTTKTKAGHVFNGTVRLDPAALEIPLRWRKPRRVFVNSMSDLFHEALPDEAIDRVFAVMALAPQHTFQVLTKRADRMRAYFAEPDRRAILAHAIMDEAPLSHDIKHLALSLTPGARPAMDIGVWPLPNVWLGVSVEDQPRADERIPDLLETPAAVRFLSCEPLLGPLDLREYLTGHEDNGVDFSRDPGSVVGGCTGWIPPVDWVICGGESGPRSRPFDIAWARSIVAQCKAAGVACFVKQLGAQPRKMVTGAGIPGHVDFARYVLSDRKGADPAEWPEDLRVQEFPDV